MTFRTDIAKALFGLVSPITWGDPTHGFVYTSQRLQIWGDCPAQPALYACQGDERYSQRSGMPPIRDLEFRLVIYQDVGRDTAAVRPADENDLILGAIECALGKFDTPDGRQTLGGLVHHARIDGTIMKDSGDLDGQAMLMIPVWVMVP